jgi:hypothetical protein
VLGDVVVERGKAVGEVVDLQVDVVSRVGRKRGTDDLVVGVAGERVEEADPDLIMLGALPCCGKGDSTSEPADFRPISKRESVAEQTPRDQDIEDLV